MQFAADQAIAALPKLLKDDVDRLRAVNLVMDISGPHEDMDPATIAMFKRIQWILRTVPHDWNEPVGERPAAPAAAMPPALAQETNSHAGASGNGHTAGQPLNAEMAAAPAGKGFIMMRENKIYEEIAVGDEATIKRVLTANDLFIFARASGNLNPMHLPQNGNEASPEIVAPSMWVGALISSVLGNVLPAGTLYKSQTLKFLDRAHVGDELSVKVRVRAKQPGNLIVLDTIVTRRNGDLIAEGIAEVLAPVRKIALDDGQFPELVVARHRHFDSLIEKARKLPPLRTAVVAPEEAHALKGAIMAAELGIIDPVLTGNRSRIEAAAKAAGCNISGYELVEAESTHEAAAKAVALVLEGRAQSLMKGHLHTDELLARGRARKTADCAASGACPTSSSWTFQALSNMLLISDAAINIAPTLEEKVDITQNAIDLALALGMKQPRVGVLSAVETVTPKIPSTLDAAILSKMAERGQILGGVVDGPLAMDNAIDMEAAKTKGITSLVAGRAEILIVPNLESGNMLAKELTFIAHADSAGIVLGAKVPVILTSRADNEKARLASCAVAALYRAWQNSSAGARREAA